jgi:hypothetical protein
MASRYSRLAIAVEVSSLGPSRFVNQTEAGRIRSNPLVKETKGRNPPVPTRR